MSELEHKLPRHILANVRIKLVNYIFTRCIMISWRCDGERDCEGGEDEDGCDIHVYPGPFCGPGQWKCTEFHLCPNNINWWEDRTCVQ